MPNFRKSAGYVMKSSLAKLTSALKLSGAWKERPQDIRKPMKEGAGTIAKKVSPAKLAPSMKDPKYGARVRPKPGGGKKVSPTKLTQAIKGGPRLGARKRPKPGGGKKVSPTKWAPNPIKGDRLGARKRPKPGGGKKIKARTGPSPKNYKRLS